MVSCGDARDGFPFLSAASLFRGFFIKCAVSLCQGRAIFSSNEDPFTWVWVFKFLFILLDRGPFQPVGYSVLLQ